MLIIAVICNNLRITVMILCNFERYSSLRHWLLAISSVLAKDNCIKTHTDPVETGVILLCFNHKTRFDKNIIYFCLSQVSSCFFVGGIDSGSRPQQWFGSSTLW